MALTPYTRVSFKPVSETTAGKTYASTVQRWLSQQKEMFIWEGQISFIFKDENLQYGRIGYDAYLETQDV